MEILTIPTATHPLTAFFHPAASGRRRPLLVVCHGFCGSAEGGGALYNVPRELDTEFKN